MTHNRKSRIKLAMEKRLGVPFRQIVQENLKLGTGRYEAARVLEELCEKHRKPKESKIKVLHSTLWYMINNAIASGELCEVEGDPSTTPIFYFNHNKSKHVSRKNNKENDTLSIEHEWHCTQCGHEWKEVKKVKKMTMMCVRGASCSKCSSKGINTFGKIQLRFVHGGINARKAVCNIGGRPRESFIDDLENPCENPFQKEKVHA